MKILSVLGKTFLKTEIKLFPFRMNTRIYLKYLVNDCIQSVLLDSLIYTFAYVTTAEKRKYGLGIFLLFSPRPMQALLHM